MMFPESPLIQICKKYYLTTPKNIVFQEPYIPFIPKNWNKIIILSEAQNLSNTNKEYVDRLSRLSSIKRIKRLYDKPNEIGIGPWDDGSLKMAVKMLFPKKNVSEVAVSNAVLWSLKGEINKNPINLINKSIEIWQELFNKLRPDTVISVGKIAEKVVCNSYLGENKIALPSSSSRRVNRILTERRKRLLKKYSAEVQRRFPKLDNKTQMLFICDILDMLNRNKIGLIKR